MRTRNVFAALGIGAFVLVCVAPELAQAQLLRGNRDAMNYPGYGYTQSYYQPYSSPYYPGYSQSYYQPYGNSMQYPSYHGGYDPCCDRAYGSNMPAYGYGYGNAPTSSYAYNPQMYTPGYAYGTPQQMPGYGYPNQQPMMPGYQYGMQPQPMMPGYQYGMQPQPMPGTSSAYSPATPMPGPGAVAGAGAQPWQQQGMPMTVTAMDGTFEPKTITVRPGTTITWTNRGEHPHTVTFPDVNRDSGELQTGGTFSATFPYEGTYNYHCRLHQGMTGTVVVSSTATGPSTTPDRTGTYPDRSGTTTNPDRTGTNPDRSGTTTNPDRSGTIPSKSKDGN